MGEIEGIWKGPVFFISHAIQTIGTHTQPMGVYRDTTPTPSERFCEPKQSTTLCQKKGLNYGHLFQYRANGPARYRPP